MRIGRGRVRSVVSRPPLRSHLCHPPVDSHNDVIVTALTGIWRYRSLVANLSQRELKLKYKGSVLGWLWSLINPATALGIYTLVFGVFLKIEPPVAGNGRLKSFALFLFAALVVWNFFSSVVGGSMAWLLGAGPLLKKV